MDKELYQQMYVKYLTYWNLYIGHALIDSLVPIQIVLFDQWVTVTQVGLFEFNEKNRLQYNTIALWNWYIQTKVSFGNLLKPGF